MMSGRVSTWSGSLVLVSLVLAAWSVSAAGGRPVLINGSEEKKTYDCRGDSAVVNGGENVLTFRNCSQITVNGGDNVIDAGVVEVINALGSGNKITWTETADGKRPVISSLGQGNTITSKPAAAGAAPVAKAAAKAGATDAAKAPPAGSAKASPAADGATGECASVAGRWRLSGTCGPDVCVITQQGCTVDLACRGGTVSYAGSVSGSTVEFAGRSGAGVAGTCHGTLTGKKLSGTCGVQGVPTCRFSATAGKQ
jgi:hypothetical protein